MHARSVFFLGLALLPLLARGQLSCGVAESLDEHWAFLLQDQPEARQPEFDDRSWARVDLPHDWSVKAPLRSDLASCTGYLPGGIGWYRKQFTIAAKPGGERVYLYFEGVYNRSEVYLNGHLLGRRPNGYVSFYYDATPYVRFDQDNTLAVRVDHSRSADSRWYTGSGIYRHVDLIRTGQVHLAPWGVFVRSEKITDNSARLRIDTEIQNDSGAEVPLEIRHELRAANGAVVGASIDRVVLGGKTARTASTTLELRDPQLWSVEHPYLYELRTTLTRDGRLLDQTTTRTGVRTFAFDPERGFSLNGVSLKMKGVCLHHDAGVLGAAVPREVWRQRLRTLKGIGCNAIRMSHNPQAPELYDLCDELGLLVLDEAFDEWEFPKRKWLRGWNVGEPGFEGSSDFFAEWSAHDLADMVRRDRNHPSVFAWSIGNEVDYPNDPYSHPILDGDGSRISQPMFGGYKPDQPNAVRLGAIAKRLVAEVQNHDPSRAVTAALAGVVMSNETEYPGALDIVGYNYTEDRYVIDHQKYPRRVIYGSENRHTRQAWSAVQDNDHIFGQFLWTGIDYLGEAGPWPSRGAGSGLLDLTGAVKPRGRFREALWSDKPVLHLGTMPRPKDDRKPIDAWPLWNYASGTPVRVLCYTNAAKARLFLDGQPVGDEKPRDTESGVISWDLSYAPGQLEAIGLDDRGTATCRARLVSSGAAASMQLSSEEPVLDRRHGVALVALQLVDAHGTPVMDAEHEVTCTVEGPARLLGLEAGNLRDASDYTDAKHRVFHGRIVAYVQATGAEGAVRVRFAAAALPDAVVTLAAR